MIKSLMSRLQSALIKQNLQFNSEVVKQLTQFLELLQQWNRVFNLTAITNEEESIYLHIVDSLIVAPYVIGHYCLDVGSGAGFPGIPLAIFYPHQQWTLLDKNIKKTHFLTQVIAELSLSNVQVVHARCEDFQFSRGFDSILSRAFTTLPKMSEITAHLLHSQGRWIAMKGQYPAKELAELSNVDYQIYQLSMVGANVTRHVVCINPKPV